VVDRDGRCHEIENLYVADASVFPSCPAVGPGLTVIALALRLADHLAGSAQ
jgi:choline dehydrogenase-like flavoprotein